MRPRSSPQRIVCFPTSTLTPPILSPSRIPRSFSSSTWSSGASTKFLDGALGILSLDDQKYIATCKGEHPKRIATEIQKTGGVSGQSLIAIFVGPPYGYPADLVRACCAGLLRGKLLRIRNEAGDEITSYRDPGVKDLFTKDRPFRKAEFFPPPWTPLPRDRVAIAKFFETYLGTKLDREDEAFADAAFQYFPHQRDVLREVERRHDKLPGRPPSPTTSPSSQRPWKTAVETVRSRRSSWS